MKKLLILLLLILPLQLNAMTRPDWLDIKNKPTVYINELSGTEDQKILTALTHVASGGVIVFPRGVYNFTHPINITNPGIVLMGSGKETRLNFSGCNGIELSGPDCQINNLSLVGQSEYTAITTNPLGYSSLKNLEINGFDVGIHLKKAINSSIEDVRIVTETTPAYGLIIGDLEATSTDDIIPTTLTLKNVSVQGIPGATMTVGIYVYHGDTILLTQCTLQYCDVGLRINSDSGTTGLARFITCVAPYFEANRVNILSAGGDLSLIRDHRTGAEDALYIYNSVPYRDNSERNYLSHTDRLRYQRNCLDTTSLSIASWTTRILPFASGSYDYDFSGYPGTYIGDRMLFNIGAGFTNAVGSHTFYTKEIQLHRAKASFDFFSGTASGTVVAGIKLTSPFVGGPVVSYVARKAITVAANATYTVDLSGSFLPTPNTAVNVEIVNACDASITVNQSDYGTFFEVSNQ